MIHIPFHQVTVTLPQNRIILTHYAAAQWLYSVSCHSLNSTKDTLVSCVYDKNDTHAMHLSLTHTAVHIAKPVCNTR